MIAPSAAAKFLVRDGQSSQHGSAREVAAVDWAFNAYGGMSLCRCRTQFLWNTLWFNAAFLQCAKRRWLKGFHCSPVFADMPMRARSGPCGNRNYSWLFFQMTAEVYLCRAAGWLLRWLEFRRTVKKQGGKRSSHLLALDALGKMSSLVWQEFFTTTVSQKLVYFLGKDNEQEKVTRVRGEGISLFY